MPATPLPPRTERLRFERFGEVEVEGLAELLSDPEITRNITANASDPDRARDAARKRIAWHNGSWDALGYGVWALKPADGALGPPGRVLGWCGFTAAHVEGHDPEILYGLARDTWGRGLASEAARAAVAWLFTQTREAGCSAIIFGRLNPGSVKISERLGMTYRGTMPFTDFLPDAPLARGMLDYELWRLREGACLDPEVLIFQAAYKSGQIVATGIAEPDDVEAALRAAALARGSNAGADPDELEQRVRAAFREGMAESRMDWYHLACEAWPAHS